MNSKSAFIHFMLFKPPKQQCQQDLGEKGIDGGLWRTSEFYAYFTIIFWSCISLITTAYNFSSSEHPAYEKYSHLLSKGWLIPWRLFDDSDPQWGGFRHNLPKLTALLSIYTLAYRIQNSVLRVLLTLVAIFLLHGTNVIKIMAIVVPCYYFSTLKQRYLGPGLTWIFVIASLFVTEWYTWDFSQVSPMLSILDNFTGFYKRWNIIFKISCLRIISFSLDHYWSHTNKVGSESHEEIGYRSRIQGNFMQIEDYTFFNYISYVFFLPLYFAGPIITFNDFMFQLKNRNSPFDYRSALKYFARLVGCFLLLELTLNLFHPVAIKQTKAFTSFSSLDFGILAFLNLKIIWLKLLVIWRYFRLFALLNQIDPPENMVRTMHVIF